MMRKPAILNLLILGAIVFFNTVSVSAERHNPTAAQVVINEIMASNRATLVDDDGDYSDWIEIYNGGDQSINLNGWNLSDNPKKPKKWTFPDITLEAGDFMLIWASDKNRSQSDKPLHTNFKIDADGESVLLTSPLGETVDQSAAVFMPADISYGKCTDAGLDWCFFDQPTPGATNITPGYRELLGPPAFDKPAGFYNGPISLNISHDDPDVTIYYTLDGSEPSPDNPNIVCLYLPITAMKSENNALSSTVNRSVQPISSCIDRSLRAVYAYKNQYPRKPGDPFGSFFYRYNHTYLFGEHIQVADRSSHPYELAAINTQFTQSIELPYENIRKAIIIRARAFKDQALPSPIVSQTYFIDAEWVSRYNLPVISVITEEQNLFDYETGIYVPGKIADQWRLDNPSARFTGSEPANYNQKGDSWERKAHIEIFGSNGAKWLSQNIGVRINGSLARYQSRKSLRLYARRDYDEQDSFNYQIFPGLKKKAAPGESLQSFKRLVLRNSGNEHTSTLFRDGLMQALVKHTLIDTQAFQPAVHFINGEYWGLINIRERPDQYYIGSHYDIDPEEIVILTGNAVLEEGVEEDRDHYLSTLEYIRENGVAAPEHYSYLQTRIDTDNYIDYQVAEIYFANYDWPGNNIDYWRKRTVQYEPAAPTGHDGRWRWILYDTDFGFGWDKPSSHNTLAHATAVGGSSWPNPDWSTFLFRSCLENQGFRNQFINRFADLLNSAFQPSRVIGLIDQMQSTFSPNIDPHIARWRTPVSNEDWIANVQVLRNFANERPEYVRGHIQAKFGLSGSAQLILQRNLDGGVIQVNSIVVDGNLPGRPSPATPYPWTGIYFKDIPITLEALPRPGYQFSGWTATPAELLSPEQASNPEISVTLAVDTTLTASFSLITP